jgi:hypothetical protein
MQLNLSQATLALVSACLLFFLIAASLFAIAGFTDINLELVARSELFLERTVARMANKIPAAANNAGQSGLRWLTISRLAKLERVNITRFMVIGSW